MFIHTWGHTQRETKREAERETEAKTVIIVKRKEYNPYYGNIWKHIFFFCFFFVSKNNVLAMMCSLRMTVCF